jgi:hypothetical protein
MATTTNYSWTTPDDTDLVKDGAAAIRTLGSSADTTVAALNPGTTAGDIDYYTTSTAKARVAIGTAGQVLKVNSGATAPEWGAVAGGFNFISRTTFSAVSGVDIDAVYFQTLTIIIWCWQLFFMIAAGTTTDVQMQGRYSTTTHTANYYYGFAKVTYGGVASQSIRKCSKSMGCANAGGSGAADESGVINFNIHREASSQLRITGQSFATQVGFALSGGGWVFSTQAWTGLRFTPVIRHFFRNSNSLWIGEIIMKKQTQPTFDIDFRKEYPTLKENHNGVDVELSPEQYEKTIAQWEANQAKAKAEYEAEIAKQTLRQAILDRLGLTADEAKLILG